MRVLIADRNARLLESIARTFAAQFRIQTATTREQCDELLLQGEFNLAVISEKLADGPGLHLLGRIARDSPDTLRIFAARRSRLQLLEGKLGPFGLFRTLAYPIDPQELLSALTLARSGLEAEMPARSVPAPAVAQPVVEVISLTGTDAMFATNVPGAIASLPRARRSNSPPAPQRLALVAPPATPTKHLTPSPASGRQSVPASQRASPQPAANRVISRVPQRAPLRAKLVLAATVVGVFLVTTLTLNLFDASVHVTRASTPRPAIAQSDTPALPQNPAPVLAAALGPAPSVARVAEPARPVVPRRAPGASRDSLRGAPVATSPDEEPGSPQIAASTTPPVADPSSFGSEAYEPIYSN